MTNLVSLVEKDLIWGDFVHDKLPGIVAREPRAGATVKSPDPCAATSVTAGLCYDAETNGCPTDKSCSSRFIAFRALRKCVLVLSATKVVIGARMAALEYPCSFDTMKGHSNTKQSNAQRSWL